MPRKSLLLLAMLAVLPLVTFAWLGWRVASVEDARFEQAYRQLLTQRLGQENRKLSAYFDTLRRRLSKEAQTLGDSPSALRDWAGNHPLVRQVMVLDREGRLVHPRLDRTPSQSERRFIDEVSQLIVDKDLIRVAFGRPSADGPMTVEPMATAANTSVADQPVDRTVQHQSSRDPTAASVPSDQRRIEIFRASESGTQNLSKAVGSRSDGWYLWYWERGLHLIYWNRWSDDRLTAVSLSRPRWMADVLALLPETTPRTARASAPADWRIRLVDAADQLVYQWGGLEPPVDAQPFVELAASPPLAAWRLKYYVDDNVVRGYSWFPAVAGLFGMAAGLLGLVVVLYREYAREMREASRRVNFVNQVSHELKTPLTNIRMYADLLENDLDRLPSDAASKPRGRLAIIVSESQRLSRLISNVLTFARSERNTLSIRRSLTDLDDTVRGVVERFAPSLKAKQIDIQLDLHAGKPVMVDAEIIEQIVGNLISNVDRYAADGKFLSVTTQRTVDSVVIEVSDHGPGIPMALQQKIFEPFFRVSDRLSDATGTGIGLAIARKLTESHDGELTYVPGRTGATFRVTVSLAGRPVSNPVTRVTTTMPSQDEPAEKRP